MGLEELTKLMTEIKDISEANPDMDTEKVLEYIHDRLQEGLLPQGK